MRKILDAAASTAHNPLAAATWIDPTKSPKPTEREQKAATIRSCCYSFPPSISSEFPTLPIPHEH